MALDEKSNPDYYKEAQNLAALLVKQELYDQDKNNKITEIKWGAGLTIPLC